MYPGGQLQLNIPVMGLVSQWEPSLQGLLIQASSLWQSKPEKDSMWKRLMNIIFNHVMDLTATCADYLETEFPRGCLLRSYAQHIIALFLNHSR